MSAGEIIAHINTENARVPQALAEALPQLERLIGRIEAQMRQGGRLFYVGCGTGGRLAALDTIEVQNTYGTPGDLIQAIFPGGLGDLLQTAESREDDLENGWAQLTAKQVGSKDMVVGLSASGTTPFVRATLACCRAHGVPTGCLVNNPGAPIAAVADYPVTVVTGPEFVTGSTRMKAGTSQKMMLDMISTSLMIRLGRVSGNLMVNARLLNAKLIDRAVRIFMSRHPEYADYEVVERLIRQHGSVRKTEQALDMR